jgi:hypothetical protein
MVIGLPENKARLHDFRADMGTSSSRPVCQTDAMLA